MILYTEAQLKQAYGNYCRKLPLIVPLPSLEEFREIFEDGLQLNEIEEWINDSK
jgi:hypothetical protein